MNKIGFNIIGNQKRRQQITDQESNERNDGEHEEDKVVIELIKSIEGKEIAPVIPLAPKKKLVIPLNTSKHSSTVAEDDLDRIAANEILAELTGESSKVQENNLIIPQSKGIEQNGKKAPLLLSGVAPQLRSIENEDERFKVDIQLRADDVSFKSSIYEDIPVSEFGAAMLRGMGWDGVDSNDKVDKKLVMRESRLGLGASAKPNTGKSNKSTKDKNKSSEKEWKEKANKKINNQILKEHDLVWLRDPQYVGKRGEIIKTRGVAGLDKIQVELEESGIVVDINRKQVILLNEEELLLQPYLFPIKNKENDEINNASDVKYFGLISEKEKIEKENDSKKRSREAIESKTNDSINNIENNNNDNNKKIKVALKNWLHPGIRVKIISKHANGSNSYLKKGSIIDVPGQGIASVKLDDGSFIESVKEKYLETVLPPIGGLCLILSGPHKGLISKLKEKYLDEDMALVECQDDLELVHIEMDGIAGFIS
eukprot:gene16339-22260_t